MSVYTCTMFTAVFYKEHNLEWRRSHVNKIQNYDVDSKIQR